MYTGLHVKCPLYWSGFNDTCIFSKKIQKMLKYQLSWKSVQWEPNRSTRTDERTDVTKLILAFRNFANAPKNIRVYTNGNRRTQKKYCADPQFGRTGFERISHFKGQIFEPDISASTGPDRQRPTKSGKHSTEKKNNKFLPR
jgi:hypothetical protein